MRPIVDSDRCWSNGRAGPYDARMGALLRVLGVLVAIGGLTGCEDYGTPGMTIRNETSAPIDIIYRRPMGPTNVEAEDVVAQVGADQGLTVIGLHQTEGPCLRGTLIAVQDGREIATLSQACEGAEWVIGPPDG